MRDKSVRLAQRQAFYILAVPSPEQQDLRRQGAVFTNPALGKPCGGSAAACRTTVGRTETALGAFYRRLSTRVGKAKAVTATARKIAVLFFNGMDYSDPGAAYYEERHRRRVLSNLQRRAKALGYVLQEASMTQEIAVS